MNSNYQLINFSTFREHYFLISNFRMLANLNFKIPNPNYRIILLMLKSSTLISDESH